MSHHFSVKKKKKAWSNGSKNPLRQNKHTKTLVSSQKWGSRTLVLTTEVQEQIKLQRLSTNQYGNPPNKAIPHPHSTLPCSNKQNNEKQTYINYNFTKNKMKVVKSYYNTSADHAYKIFVFLFFVK